MSSAARKTVTNPPGRFRIVSTIVRLEWRQLRRSIAWSMATVVLCVASLVAVYHGRTVIERQRAAIANSPAIQAEQHAAVLAAQPADASGGDQLYYLFFHTAHQPSAWAPVSLGQRDLHPFNLKIRLLALHGQLYDVEFGNPLLAAFGNFDLAFVLVFVVPLFVIALTHNLWSLEREQGTWALVTSHATSAGAVLGMKLGVRLAAIGLPLLMLLAAAAWWLALPLDGRLLAVTALSFAYVLLWGCLSLLVGALRRSSDVNLAVLLGVWIAGCVLGPSLVNAAAAVRYPLSEGLELTVLARQGFHEAWDRPLEETMARFYQRYPQWRAVTIPKDRYSNGWYYAMQQRGDDEAEPAVNAYRAALARRQGSVSSALVFFPPALFQAALNAIARTDLDAHLAYLDSVASYHEALKAYFFPVSFHDTPAANVAWNGAPRHSFRDDRSTPWLGFDGMRLAAWAILACMSVGIILPRFRH